MPKIIHLAPAGIKREAEKDARSAKMPANIFTELQRTAARVTFGGADITRPQSARCFGALIYSNRLCVLCEFLWK